MWKSRMSFLLALILLFPSIAVSAGLPSDKALDKPVTLAVKGEALTDIMPMLEKQTGVRLRAAKEIAEQKATVFIDGKPLRQVMEGLSTLFGYHWTKKTFSTGDIYELWQEDSARRKLTDQHAKAWEAAWRAADADIELKAKLGAMSKEEREVLRRQLTEGGNADSPQVKSHLEAIKSIDDPLVGPTARLFCAMTADIRKMAQPGVEIKYNTLSPESEWVLPEDIAGRLMNAVIDTRGAQTLVSKGDIANIGLEFILPNTDKAVSILGVVSPTVKTAGRSYETWGMGTALTYQRVFEYLPSDNISLPRISDLSALEKKVSITPEEIVKERGRGPASSSAANRSDILAILHGKLGLQIISDHYSEWTTGKMPAETTVLEIARDLDSSASSFLGSEQNATWGWDGLLLYMRAKDIWHSDAMEIPNRVLRQWAASYRDRGYLDLYEQAAIATLGFEQFGQLESCREYLGLRKDTGLRNTAGLRLFGLMSEKQQKEALAGGTSVDRFTPEQSRALTALLPGSFSLPRMGPDGVLNMSVGVWTTDLPRSYRLDKPQSDEPVGTPVSVSIREGAPPEPEAGMRAPAAGGSGGPGGDGPVLTMGPEKSEGERIDYTMSIAFADGSPFEFGITIPGGEPDKSGSGETGK